VSILMRHLYMINDAINNEEVITIRYKGMNRVIAPKNIIRCSNGNVIVKAWQFAGAERGKWEGTGRQGWRSFIVQHIKVRTEVERVW